MREVVFVDYCDEHFAENVKVEATAIVTLGIDGEWKTVAACEEHAAKWLTVQRLLRAHGIKVDQPRRRSQPMQRRGRPSMYDGPTSCPMSGCEDRPPSPSRKVWRQHLKQFHHLTLFQFQQQHPELVVEMERREFQAT